MKAIDYALRLNGKPDIEVFKQQLTANLETFLLEIRLLADTRGIKTAEGLKPIVRELQQKYAAYAKIVNKSFFRGKNAINERGFIEAVKNTMPELYQIFITNNLKATA